MHFIQAINSDLSVLIVCNKTGGTIKGDMKNVALAGRKEGLTGRNESAIFTFCMNGRRS